MVFRNSEEANGRPTASQTKLNVPAALVELFSDRSNICFNATSGLKAREKIHHCCSHGAVRRPTQGNCFSYRRPPTGRWLQSRTVDIDDLALIRPIFPAVNQACTNWISADIFPFLRVAFIVAQHVIEESFLPNLCVLSRPTRRFGQRLFQHSNPSAQNKSWSAADKQMDMVRHNHIAANCNTKLVRGALSKENKCSMNFMASQTCSSVMRAKGDKVERTRTKKFGRDVTAGVQAVVSCDRP